MKNCFYVFEGIDGSGKTTLIDALKKQLIEKSFYFTKEPFGTMFSFNIKSLLYEAISKNDYVSEYLLFAAARAHHIKTVILPYLNSNYHVITDRFFYSSMVYQGMHLDESFIDLVYKNSNYGLNVDKIFFCKISPEIALQRMERRNSDDVLDNHYKTKLSVLANRYNQLFKDNPSVVTLDMSLPINVLIEQIMIHL